MLPRFVRRSLLLRCVPPLLAVAAWAALSTGSTALASSSAGSSSGSLTFDATFASGTRAPFAGAQCANTGTAAKTPRYRGILNISSTTSLGVPAPGVGTNVAQITDGPPAGTGYKFVQCELDSGVHALPIGQTVYYGLMIYEPVGWSIPNHFPFGTNVEEFAFQAIFGAPVILQLHGNESTGGPHVTLALETGACQPLTYASGGGANGGGGCTYRSNADNSTCKSSSTVHCLPGYYAIPPKGVGGSPGFVEGQWNEIVMGVHWAASGGSIQTWYKVKGASTWNTGNSVSGIPTLQWHSTSSGPSGSGQELTESYTGTVTSPFSVYLDNDLEGTSLGAVEGAMP